jgi:peptide/nickel transport system permease protein
LEETNHTSSIWRKLIRNSWAAGGAVIIMLAIIVACLGYLVTPDKTPQCNQQFIELAARKPGYKTAMLRVARNEKTVEKSFFGLLLSGEKNRFELKPFDSLYFEDSGIVLLSFAGDDQVPVESRYSLADVCYPVSLKNSLIEMDQDRLVFKKIDEEEMVVPIDQLRSRVMEDHIVQKRFLLGTDSFGRDLLSRMILGTRVSLSVGFIAVGISLIIGLTLGLIAGYYRGRVDQVIMWLINVVWSIPTLLMVISIALVLGQGFWQVFVAVGLTMWVEVARVVRGQVISIRELEYVDAARTLGMSPARIIIRHIIPNAINPVIIISAANFASAILIEAGLSFLGIGVQPPIPSWGSMVRDHYGYMIVDKAYLAFLPGLAIMIMVLAFTMLGNGLRDALDVRND